MITGKCKVKHKIAYILLALAVLSLFQTLAIAQSAMEQPVETITEDRASRHLGDEFKPTFPTQKLKPLAGNPVPPRI